MGIQYVWRQAKRCSDGRSVDLDVLHQRLLRRARETPQQIEQRLARNTLFDTVAAERDGLHVLDNSSHVERTVDDLLALIGASRACA